MKFDTYTIKARIFPFLLLCIPIVSLIATQFTIKMENISLLPTYIISLVAMIAAIFVRDRGKSIQKKLWNDWGGAPTVRFLRQSNNEFNPITRNQCYRYFKKHISGIKLPTMKEELENPQNADAIYEMCIAYLRSKSRDKKKYYLVYSENINYGFLRNSFGIKPLGITLSLISFAISVLLECIQVFQLGKFNSALLIPIIISFIELFYWILFVTKASIKRASETYANRLLEICLDDT